MSLLRAQNKDIGTALQTLLTDVKLRFKHICYHAKELLSLTSRRNPPNAKQNTNGPARSVSSIMDASVCCSGFKTDNV